MEDKTNTTCCLSEAYVSYTERQILAALGVVACPLGVIGNMLVIAAVILSKKLHNTTNMFVLNLAIADLLTCLITIPVTIVAVLIKDHWPLPMAVCKMSGFLAIVCIGCNVNSLACIAVNRLVLVTQSKATYRRLYGRKRTLLAIVIIWLIPCSVAIILQCTGYIRLGYNPKFSSCTWVSRDPPGFGVIIFVTFYSVQVFLILWSYARVFYHIRCHTMKVRPANGPGIRPSVATVMEVENPGIRQQNGRTKLQVRVTKNMFLVVCCFVLCITPYGVSMMLVKIRHAIKFVPIAGAILCSNSCVNPIIYAAKHPHFRVVFRYIIRGKFKEIPERISLRIFN